MERLEELKTGKVYLVYDSEKHRMAVEKHLQGRCAIYERLKALPHPYLPKLYEVKYTEDETIVFEEYINGSSIGTVSTTEKQIKKWLFELCDVLKFLHKNNIIHRDIKPSNILLGSDGHIRLIDFDAAREEKEEAESDTRLLGTRGYAPPEQYGFAQTDERADIYALGITFRKLLGEKAKKPRWKRILKKCTEIEPKKRYRHVLQIEWAIRLGQLRRRVLYPAVIVCFSAFSAFMLWGYTTDTDMKEAMNIVLSSRRDLIFDTADMDAIKSSDVRLPVFNGNAVEVYTALKEKYPLDSFISTGYSRDRSLIFGAFSTEYTVATGELHYRSFEGLCYIDESGTVELITPDKCQPYAPAVLYLYELDIFDTLIF